MDSVPVGKRLIITKQQGIPDVVFFELLSGAGLTDLPFSSVYKHKTEKVVI
jgi:hypothetical protein